MYDELLKYPNVIGAGLGIMTKCGERYSEGVVVMVSQKLPLVALRAQDVIPKEHHGVVTDVMQVGHVRALRTGKYRPAPGGVSIGHYMITAGTLGCVLYDVQTGNTVILSNNHVLANSNAGSIDDPILQPGPYDGGKYPDDHIANLLRFVEIGFGEEAPTCPLADFTGKVLNFTAKVLGSSHRMKAIKTSQAVNKVDAAIAMPLDGKDVEKSLLEIPVMPTETIYPQLGMKVTKSGRTTGVTESEIVVVSATVTVNYGGNNYAKFEEQFVTGPMSQGGDSGSLVVSDDKAVGLLFAGSEQVTICNYIENVFDTLNLTF